MPSSGRLLEFQNNILTIWLAIFSVCCMDFSVNAGEFFFQSLSVFVPVGRPDKTTSASRRSCPSRRYPSSRRTGKGRRLGCHHAGYWQRVRVFLVSATSKVYSRSLSVLSQDSGGIDMPSLFPFLGNTELEVLSVVGSILLIGTHLTTITAVKERILLASGCAQVLSSTPTAHKLNHLFSQKNKEILPPRNERSLG